MNESYPYNAIPSSLTPYSLLPFQEADEVRQRPSLTTDCNKDNFTDYLMEEGTDIYENFWIKNNTMGIFIDGLTYADFLESYYNFKYAEFSLDIQMSATRHWRGEVMNFDTVTKGIVYPSFYSDTAFASPLGRLCGYPYLRWKITESNFYYDLPSVYDLTEVMPTRTKYLRPHLGLAYGASWFQPFNFNNNGEIIGSGMVIRLPTSNLNFYDWYKSLNPNTNFLSPYGDGYWHTPIQIFWGNSANIWVTENLPPNAKEFSITLNAFGNTYEIPMILYMQWMWRNLEVNASGSFDYKFYDPL